MADPNDNNTGAPGTSPALPSGDDVARNERERRQAIGVKARWLVQQHIEHGRPIGPDDLRGFGKDGCAYFSRQLRAATKRQLQEADTAEPAPRARSTAVEKNRPLLVEIAEWRALQRRRKHHASTATFWGILSAIGSGILSYGLAAVSWDSTVFEAVSGLLHHVTFFANGF